jgi:hypothetical protein
LITVIEFLDIIILFFYLKRFGDWNLSPSSGKSLLNWAHSIELVPISGHRHQYKTGYINYTQHKPSDRVKTNIKTLDKHEARHNLRARVFKIRVLSK